MDLWGPKASMNLAIQTFRIRFQCRNRSMVPYVDDDHVLGTISLAPGLSNCLGFKFEIKLPSESTQSRYARVDSFETSQALQISCPQKFKTKKLSPGQRSRLIMEGFGIVNDGASNHRIESSLNFFVFLFRDAFFPGWEEKNKRKQGERGRD